MNSYSARWMIGIDEAGRGPLAGPVVVAGVMMESKMKNEKWKKEFPILDGIRDSKKLSPKKREQWFRILTRRPEIRWAVARVWPRTIDRINIARAADLGARRVFSSLSTSPFGGVTSEWGFRVLLDGGLRLPARIPHEVIIKGDEKEPVIAAASIIAKVTRDRIMLGLHKKYPQYGFDRHKGYGTRAHREVIGQIGVSEIHRRSFRLDSTRKAV